MNSAAPLWPLDAALPPFVFERAEPVRFGHCDPAGIVFFPRYFEMLNGLVEDWFTQGLGVSFAELHGPRRVGLPSVRIDSEFRRASRMGETLRLRLALLRVGRSSLELLHRFEGDDGLRVQFRQTLVCTSLDAMRAQPFPADLRAALDAAWQQSEAMARSAALSSLHPESSSL